MSLINQKTNYLNNLNQIPNSKCNNSNANVEKVEILILIIKVAQIY